MTSIWEADLVTKLTSWQRQCALVNRILVKYFSFSDDDMSSHWNPRLMLVKAKRPSPGRSDMRRLKFSLMMTREMNEELLLVTLFLGFFLLEPSLVSGTVSKVLPSPNAGVKPAANAESLVDVPRPSSLFLIRSDDSLSSGDASPRLDRGFSEKADAAIPLANITGGVCGSSDSSETLVPALSGFGSVASGFGLIIGASEGCGGGVAR